MSVEVDSKQVLWDAITSNLLTEQKCFELEKRVTVGNEAQERDTKSSTVFRQQVSDLGESL